MASKAIPREQAGGVARTTIMVLLILCVLALLYVRSGEAEYIASYFFVAQDMPVLVVLVVLALVVRFALGSAAWVSRLGAWMTAFERTPVWVMAAFVTAVGAAGSWLVFAQYPLSMDEFWARADGVILAHGAPMAHIAPQWLPYAKALQPIFMIELPHAGLWSSNYLPVNALIQLALGPFASPLLAAASVLLVAAIARRLMPEHPTAPAVCALILVGSSQLLVMAMTPYAMTAHLAFNLAWLWLFLRRTSAANFAAIAVGFLATGLHQLVFFPIFALPFLVERFVSGQRGWPVAHLLAIAAGVLAWSNYEHVAAGLMGVTPEAGAARGTGFFLGKMVELMMRFHLADIGLMGLNLLRFVLWQNPIALPLFIVALAKGNRLPGPLHAAMAGIVLMPLFMLFVEPFQGHGWGYRYLHGELGSLALLATYGWFRIINGERGAWRTIFPAGLAISVAVLLPVRAYQAWRQAAPYVAANRALSHVDADVVVIDAPFHAYSWDLVRNSPMLDNTPKRMAGYELDDRQLAQLCQHYRVSFFRDDDAGRFGIFEFARLPASSRVRACRN